MWPRAVGGTIALYPLPATQSFQLTASGDLGDSADALRLGFAQRTESTGVRLGQVSWMSNYRVVIRTAGRFQVGRVLLAGDAAHVYPPAGGQGMNAGIQDAYNLGWKIGNVLAGAPSALLDTYETERMPVASRTREAVSSLYHRSLLGDTSSNPQVPDGGQLAISYRDEPLALGRRGRARGLQVGDRAPDAVCHDVSGAQVRLFDVFRGPHTTVLAFGSRYGDHATALDEAGSGSTITRIVARAGNRVPDSAIVDAHGHAHRAYGITTDTIVAVRPDGHIGMIVEDTALANVHERLRTLGLSVSTASSEAQQRPRPERRM